MEAVMMSPRRIWPWWLIVTAVLSASSEAAQPGVVVRSVKGDFADVKERVLFAVENRGLVLNYTSHIGAMLERTGKDIGRPRVIYRDAQLLEFCSAAVSRATMEADPRNIVFCPYSMAVYTLPAEPGRVYVAYRKPPAAGSDRSAQALRAVGKLLDDIADEALK
jgi:uncharacterized protein (DUF302 family)